MRMTYDSAANAAYIYLVDRIQSGEVTRSAVAHIKLDQAAVTVDFDSDGRILGIEILGASRVLRDETTSTAEDIT